MRAVEPGELEGIALTLAIGSAIVMWWGAVRVLSHAMVGRPIKRVAFMAVVPVALFLAVAIVTGPFVGLAKFAEFRDTADPLSGIFVFLAVCLTMGASTAVLIGLNRVTAWIVRHDQYSNRVGGVTPIDYRAASSYSVLDGATRVESTGGATDSS